ncbi:ComEA family DNA-binding protein [Fournierella sp.]|uniref:ComEA family DNA-binding protein n=1 Tax=Allofournierella sp. TaxID=1940256 RepID=UPI0025BB6F98|nr:ComEA family DNA-binding protein [Fournierella sp.]
MAGDRTTGRVLLSCVTAFVLLLAGAVGFSVPFWQPGYRTVASEEFDVQQMMLVDLNSAGLEELCSLPGVGEKKAQAILDYREEHGSFSSIDELDQVDGISAKSIEAWRSRLYIESDEMQKEER